MLLLLLSFAPFLLFFSKSAGASPIFLFRKYLAAARLALGSMRVATRESGGADEVVAEEAADGEMSVLDLPELALDCILERLPPAGLCNMSAVCSSLKDRCRSDHLWGGHMREKWGHVMGRAVTEEWRRFAASRTEAAEAGKLRGLAGMISRVLPASWARAMHMAKRRQTSSLPADSAMSCYLALESGKFWLPAQVYNRENGHSGFMLSCYDAELSYNWRTDKFQARYPPHGKRPAVLEDDITWDRIRAPPVDTSPHDLHISDCLDDLRPGDHFEIQWRRNKEFPYGWWYGVVGHLESCGGSKLTCWCHKSDTIALEFNHYAAGSRWRRGMINRKDHREGGSEMDGFYGGIRKIESKEEISTWRRLWPADGME